MGLDSEDGSTTTYSLLGPLRYRCLAGTYRSFINVPLSLTWSFQSLNTGRPPSFSLAYVDCGFPQYDASSSGKGGSFGSSCKLFDKVSWTHILSPIRSFFTVEIWQCRFAAECVAEVTSRILTAEVPSYATIMELDRKVREFPLPEGMVSSSDDLAGSFQKCVLDHIRETGTDIFLSFLNQSSSWRVYSTHVHPPKLLCSSNNRPPCQSS